MLYKESMPWIFIHIPKCGGTSIWRSLNISMPKGYDQHCTLTKLLTKGYINTPIGIEDFKQKFSFTVIRNPWDRMVSWFFFQKINTSFKQWILTGCPFPDNRMERISQYSLYTHEDVTLTKTYRFNELQRHWPEICKGTIGKNVGLLHLNKSSHKPYQDYYDRQTRDQVAKLCEKDIDLNKWTFNN